MASIWTYLLLGAVQGATEFLPVSSSGHLTLLEHLLGLKPSLSLNVLLHLGTLIALLLYFQRDLKDILKRLKEHTTFLAGVTVMTIVTAAIGLPLKKLGILERVGVLPISFSATTALLLLSLRAARGDRSLKELSWKDAILIGLAQGIAVIPGISRSGATIVTAMLLGYSPEEAFKLSFIGGIPAVVGAVIVELPDMTREIHLSLGLAGMLTSLIVGLSALELLKRVTVRGRISWFSLWTALAAACSIIIILKGG